MRAAFGAAGLCLLFQGWITAGIGASLLVMLIAADRTFPRETQNIR
jgi:hypothetical protein